jgi:hypothetical protein
MQQLRLFFAIQHNKGNVKQKIEGTLDLTLYQTVSAHWLETFRPPGRFNMKFGARRSEKNIVLNSKDLLPSVFSQ